MKTLLKVDEQASVVIARIDEPKLGLDIDDQLRNELQRLSPESEKRPLLVDLSRVEFVPSATIGTLVELANRCRKSDRPLALIRLQPKVREILELCALDHVFSIHADEQEALASI